MALGITKPLNTVKESSLVLIDSYAGLARQRYLTTVPGQDISYATKLEEAKAYIAAGYPSDASPYPWVALEAAATGDTPAERADFILATANYWNTKGAEIEAARITGKQNVNAATTIAAVYAITQTTKITLETI
jgi:hypothetical protein